MEEVPAVVFSCIATIRGISVPVPHISVLVCDNQVGLPRRVDPSVPITTIPWNCCISPEVKPSTTSHTYSLQRVTRDRMSQKHD